MITVYYPLRFCEICRTIKREDWMYSEDRPLSFPRAMRILDFIHFKNPDDMRLIDFINRHAGCTAMPNRNGIDHAAARRIVMAAYEIIKEK